ncbi:hypothetical protein SACS_0507 [Parasaccharibacter apium]|uniref:Uncharacterized protein n=1 Tax=Parasaccharibacter apium TaxID=1510841 RepID=A0A7U7J080_9PROT|nr:hypothetical protein SACS_0507 [Parasaccharibacter apium]
MLYMCIACGLSAAVKSGKRKRIICPVRRVFAPQGLEKKLRMSDVAKCLCACSSIG